MRINAYILAADPAWIETSLASYYAHVDEIVVSFDQGHKGWTGAPIDVEQCLRRLAAIDTDKKMRLAPGDFFRAGHTPMANETHQRQCAADLAAKNADWVLQLDTDEVLPNWTALTAMLEEAQRQKIAAVEWPMRVLFRTLADNRFLEVCGPRRADRFEYPGPIAIRPGTPLVHARRAAGAFLRPAISGDTVSLQVNREPEAGEIRVNLPDADDAILHYSWARPAKEIKAKIASWSHNEGLKSWIFYYLRWKPAPLLWRYTRNFHPFSNNLWPALKPHVTQPRESLATLH